MSQLRMKVRPTIWEIFMVLVILLRQRGEDRQNVPPVGILSTNIPTG
jgi:hypothetical protein